MRLPRMRTATDIMDELKAADPETRVTLNYIRQIIHEKRVPVLEVGRKKLVNADDLLEYIARGTPAVSEETQTSGVRRVVP